MTQSETRLRLTLIRNAVEAASTLAEDLQHLDDQEDLWGQLFNCRTIVTTHIERLDAEIDGSIDARALIV